MFESFSIDSIAKAGTAAAVLGTAIWYGGASEIISFNIYINSLNSINTLPYFLVANTGIYYFVREIYLNLSGIVHISQKTN